MTTVRTKIFRTHDPYANLPKLPLNLKGLSNNEPVLRSHIDALKPKVIVEVGTYLGASAVFMARHGLLYQPDIEVVCVDTFLGSVEHWMGADIVPNLGNGRLNLYFQFLNNVVEMNLVNYITPFPIDS
ncbi:MAG: hypothetical protein ACREQ5_30040, partial [Candidatus Dormibacteria bacterium]